MSKTKGIVRPLGLALILAIGFGTVFAIAIGWGITVWESLHNNRTPYENLVVRADGTPLIQRYTYDGYQNQTYYALDGSEVPRPKDNQNEAENFLSGVFLTIPRDDVLFPLDGSGRVRSFADGQTPGGLWYFIDNGARDGLGYFVGYDSQSKLCVGFIGRDGFRPDQPPVEQWFPMDGVNLASHTAFSRYAGIGNYWPGGYEYESREFPTWRVDMISGDQLIEVDLQKRSVTTLMKSPDLIALGILETVSTSKAAGDEQPSRHRHQHLAVRTSDRVLVFDAPEKQPATFVLSQEFRDRRSIGLYEVGPGTMLLQTSHTPPDHSRRDELAWIDASGNILRRAEVSLSGGRAASDEAGAWLSVLVAPAPIVTAFLATVAIPWSDVAGGLSPSYSAALARTLGFFWPALLVVTLLSAALAAYCYRRHCRYYQAFSGLWLVFVLLGGVPGLVGYLFHRRWPVLEKCPACGQDVPRDRQACAQCGAAFPPPEPKGCEVFA